MGTSHVPWCWQLLRDTSATQQRSESELLTRSARETIVGCTELEFASLEDAYGINSVVAVAPLTQSYFSYGGELSTFAIDHASVLLACDQSYLVRMHMEKGAIGLARVNELEAVCGAFMMAILYVADRPEVRGLV